jgi:SagB-type dehydrogenase family enzyme
MFTHAHHHDTRSVSDNAPLVPEAAEFLEYLLRTRRSVRRFRAEPVPLNSVAQLVWAAQGNVNEAGLRTVPSAGALYPLTVYAVAGHVDGLNSGVYKYVPRTHNLACVQESDLRDALSVAAFGQVWVRHAPVDLVITADFTRTTDRYHDRGLRYVYMEAGHAAENVYLLATALGLGTVAIGAFDDDLVVRTLHLPVAEHPLYIMPIGIPYCAM